MKWAARQLEINDVPVLLDWYNNEELHYIANAKKYKPYTLEKLTEYWREKLSRSNTAYYVILLDGQVVGRVGLKKKEKDVEYSILIGVPTLYSKGLGTQVTKYFIVEAFRDPDVLTVYLNVRGDNLRAIKCYENAGFKTTIDFYENHTKMFEMKIERG